MARYLERLESEASEVAAAYPAKLDTLYFGGGTPSHLTDPELERVFRALGRAFGSPPGQPAAREVTLEADPLTFDSRRLELFRELGVTRLSIGLQSTQDPVLSFLGRAHDAEAGLTAVRDALASGLEVNVDIIMAVPGQDLKRDLTRVLELGVNHLSVYSLTIEENTPFYRRGVRVDPEVDADAFELAAELVPSYGLQRYEVSNFAKPGHESLHNLAYWRGDYYLALGPSASAYLPDGRFGTRSKNPPIKGWLLGAPKETETLTREGVVVERLMTGLRTREGVNLGELEALTGISVQSSAPAWYRDTTEHGLLRVAPGGWLRATPVGLERLDAVLRAFVQTFRAPMSEV